LGLTVGFHLVDEKCLGLFSSSRPRDDDLPALFLHCAECWGRAKHSCPDLPDAKDYDVDKHDAIPDYDHYNPTLHSLLDKLVIGDTKLVGCQVNWTRVKSIFEEW
jgi:hypothetical protein